MPQEAEPLVVTFTNTDTVASQYVLFPYARSSSGYKDGSGVAAKISLDTTQAARVGNYLKSNKIIVGKTLIKVNSGTLNSIILRNKDIFGKTDNSQKNLIIDPYQKQGNWYIIQQPYELDFNHYLKITLDASQQLTFYFYPTKTTMGGDVQEYFLPKIIKQ